jgi:hypothetical protein
VGGIDNLYRHYHHLDSVGIYLVESPSFVVND